MMNTIEEFLEINEKIIWKGKPSHFLYSFGNIYTYIFAIFWGAFDYNFIRLFLDNDGSSSFEMLGLGTFGGIPIFFIVFFILHLTPVWYAIFGFPYRFLIWYKVEYIITSKRVYFLSNFIGKEIQSLDHTKIQDLEVKISLIEKFFNKGTIKFNSAFTDSKNSFFFKYKFISIDNPYEIYKILKEINNKMNFRKDESSNFNKNS